VLVVVVVVLFRTEELVVLVVVALAVHSKPVDRVLEQQILAVVVAVDMRLVVLALVVLVLSFCAIRLNSLLLLVQDLLVRLQLTEQTRFLQ
jgi:hypothetical protein